MTESDYNAIKPLPTLPSVTGLNPSNDGQRRDKKRNARKRPQERADLIKDPLSPSPAENVNNNLSINDTDEHRIDYCA